MHESKKCVENSSQASGSGSPSVLLHSSKLRNKLEKLAPWRIDPSLIEFPQDTREFCWGFAKVSQGLLTFPSPAEGDVNKPDGRTDELLSSKADGPQSDNDTEVSGENHRSNDEETDGHTPDGDNDHPEGEGTEDHDKEQKLDDRTSTLGVGDGSARSGDVVNGGPDLGDRDPLSKGGTERPEGYYQPGNDEGTDSWIAGNETDQTIEGLRREFGDAENGPPDPSQTSSRKVVAVKRFKVEVDTDLERVLGLALKESGFLVELFHPNIVKLEGFVEDLSEGKVWLIFPWEENGNLRDFLASGEREIPERISLIHDVTLGLEYLHSLEPPIYHGDLKSLNILVESECHALITDFGSARHLERDETAKQPKNEHKHPPTPHPTTGEEQITLEAFFNATASTLTLTGSSYTIRWAAPELLQDEKPCLRSDIWSLGWIAYEVMTNTIPFHNIKQDAIVINRVVQGHLPSVTEHARMSLIRALCSLMVQCWSINPEKRPTAEECRKSISWMPRIVPASTQTIDKKAAELRHAQLLIQLGVMYRNQAEYPSALSCFTGALDIYTSHKDNEGRAVTLRNLADAYRFWNHCPEALEFYSQALQVYADLDDENGRATTMFGLAVAHGLLNEYDEAVKLYSECLQIHTNTGNKRERATALWGLAEVHRNRAEYKQAIKLHAEALQIYTDVGDTREKAVTLWGLAEVHRSQEEYSEAIKLFSEALQIHTDVGDRGEEASTLWSLADVHKSQREYSEAITLYSKAVQIYTDIGDNSRRARASWELAQMHRLQEEYTEADKLYSEALQITTEIGDRYGRGLALFGLAEVHRSRHQHNEAIKLFSEAKQIFIDLGDRYWVPETLMSLAETNHMRGHSNEAAALYTEVSEVLKEMGKSGEASNAMKMADDIRKTLAETTADAAEAVEIAEDPTMNAE